MADTITLADYEKAEADLRATEGRQSFLVHAAIYVLVNIMLIVMNLVFVPDVLWFIFPLIGWGIGLGMHYLFAVSFTARQTEAWQAKVERRAREIHAPRASAP
jgi:hypothetical protein